MACAVYLSGAIIMNLSQQESVSASSLSAAAGKHAPAQPDARVLSITHIALLIVAAVCLAFGLSGCGDSRAAPAASPPPPPVHVATVEQRTISDWDIFTGRFEAVESVKLRPRVSG
jgi:hypothetical protein